MNLGLTARQAELLAFIRSSIKHNGCAPSYAEMAGAMGIASRGAVAGMVDRLEERGVIRRVAGSARSISIVEQGGLSAALEARIAAYCRCTEMTRSEFDKRAAEALLRARQ